MTSTVPGASNSNNIRYGKELEALQIWGKFAPMFS
jgi:hypothetical protein